MQERAEGEAVEANSTEKAQNGQAPLQSHLLQGQDAAQRQEQQQQQPPKLKIRLGSSVGPSSASGGDGEQGVSSANALTPAPTPTPAPAAANGFGHHSHSDTTQGNANGTGAGIESMALDNESEDEKSKRVRKEQDEEEAAQQERDRAELELHLQKDLLELPQIAREHLVPLTEIVRRVVARSFSELQSLVEILPAKPDFERKRSIIEYVISTRRQIVKLLVLLRWSKENVKDTERSINLIAFLQRQNYQLERAVEGLKGVRELLGGARVRNYDIATAIDVLTSGTYTRLPPIFKDSFIPPSKLTPAEIVNLLQDLETVIRYRLQMYEQIPLQMLQKSYHIHDGRVTFTCPGLFKASFTLGGDALSDQWYLVDFSFNLEGRHVQATPTGAMRDHILQVVNDLLAKAAADMQQSTNGPLEHASANQESDIAPTQSDEPKPRRSHAFCRAYELLQSLCINYQMELLHYHAAQTNATPTIWQNRLAISLNNDRSELTVKHVRPSKPLLPTPVSWDQSLQITIVPKQVNELRNSTPTSSVQPKNLRIASYLTTLAKDLDGECPTLSVPDGHSDSQLSRQPITKGLLCTYTRTPVYFDNKGKRFTPTPGSAVLTNNPQTEEKRPIDIFYPTIESSSDLHILRDFEVILGDCFTTTINRQK